MEFKCQANRVSVIYLVLFGCALLTITSPAVRAQEPDKPTSEVQQLREKLQKLEQTVQELKKQLEDIGQPKITAATATSAQAVDKPPADPPATSANKKQEEKIGESTFQIYASRCSTWAISSTRTTPTGSTPSARRSCLRSKDEFAPDGKSFFDVRQRRLGVKSTTATKFGELKTQFEFELFGAGIDAGQTTFRLRHAYDETTKEFSTRRESEVRAWGKEHVNGNRQQ
jgi:hypothetical protein